MISIYDEYDSYVDGGYFSSPKKNLGNKLFIYACSRIIADILDYNLYVPDNPLVRRENFNTGEYLNEKFPFGGIFGRKKVTNPINIITDYGIVHAGSIENYINETKNHGYINQSYFSKYDYIKPYKNLVKQYYAPLINNSRNNNDIVIMLRNSRIDGSFVLPDSYYLDILENETFDNLYVSIDHYDRHQNLLNKIKKYKPIFIETSILSLFKEITSFTKIIGAQGTFSFWACFLSNAKKIYWPITNDGPNSGKNSNNTVYNTFVNLIVDDEDRYQFIKIKNIYE